MNHKIWFLLVLIALIFSPFTKVLAEGEDDWDIYNYTIPVPVVSADLIGEDKDVYGVRVFWQMPEEDEGDAYGFVVDKEGPNGREQAAVYFPASAGFDDITNSGFYYDEAVEEGDTYNYYVKAYDRSGKESDWGKGSVSLVELTINNIQVQDITQTSAKVVYELDLGGAPGHTAFVRYGETTEYGQIAGDSFGGDQSPYRVPLSNLQAGHLYHYQLGIYPSPTGVEPDFSKVDQATWGEDQTFRTLSDININSLCVDPYPLQLEPNFPISGSVQIVTYATGTFWDSAQQKYVERQIQVSDKSADIKANCTDPNNCSSFYAPISAPYVYYNQGVSYVTTRLCKLSDQKNCMEQTFVFNNGSPGCIRQNYSAPAPAPPVSLSVMALSPDLTTQDDKSGTIQVNTSALNNQDQTNTDKTTLATNGLQVAYGTQKDKYANEEKFELKDGKYTVTLPNLKSRTYHYRIISTDKDGKQFVSQEYTLKHGNRFVRFWGDLWEKVKSVFKK